MKKVSCLLLATSMALMVAGCSGEADTTKDANTTAATAPDMRVYELNGVEYKIPMEWETYEDDGNYYYYPDGRSAAQTAMLMVNYSSMDGEMDYSNASEMMDAYAEGVGEADGASHLLKASYPEWDNDALKLTYDLDIDSDAYHVSQYAAPVLYDGIFSIGFFGGEKYQDTYDLILESVKFPSFPDAALDKSDDLDDLYGADSGEDDDDYDYDWDDDDSSASTSSVTSSSGQNENLSTERASALQMAHDYLKSSAFSRTGLIEQLEYEGFSKDDATYAVDNCGADWKAQAALMAKQYRKSSAFSHKGLVDQLEYEGFTPEQAEYGATQSE